MTKVWIAETRPDTARTLLCRADGCSVAMLGKPEGHHHVMGCDPTRDRFHRIVTSVFVCSAHLEDAQKQMVEHMKATRSGEWTVEVFRMTGWEDDGRGSYYVHDEGSGGHTRQELDAAVLTLF